jgi:hypothetical protein
MSQLPMTVARGDVGSEDDVEGESCSHCRLWSRSLLLFSFLLGSLPVCSDEIAALPILQSWFN